MQFKNIVFVNVFGLRWDGHGVAQQREAGQRVVILVGLVEEEAEVGEDDPQFLPTVAVLKLAQ